MDLLAHLSNLDRRDVERAILIHSMGTEAKKLHDDGYGIDADRVLDELSQQLKSPPTDR